MIAEEDRAGEVSAEVLAFVTILVRGSGLDESLALERIAEKITHSVPMKSRVRVDFLCRFFRIIRAIPIPIIQRLNARRAVMKDSLNEIKI